MTSLEIKNCCTNAREKPTEKLQEQNMGNKMGKHIGEQGQTPEKMISCLGNLFPLSHVPGLVYDTADSLKAQTTTLIGRKRSYYILGQESGPHTLCWFRS